MNNKTPLLIVWWPSAHAEHQTQEEGRALLVRFEVHAAPLGQKLHGGVEALSKLPKNLPCLVLIDPTELGLFAISPPRVSGRKLQEALPFLVEQFLLNEPEENHVALWPLLPHRNDNQQLASVLDKRRVQDIVKTCKQMDLKLTGIGCESLRSAVQTAHPCVAWFSGEFFYLIDSANVPLVLETSQSVLFDVMLNRQFALLSALPAQPKVAMGASDFEKLLTLCPGVEASVVNHVQVVAQALVTPLVALQHRAVVTGDDFRKLGVRLADARGLAQFKKLAWPLVLLVSLLVVGLNVLAWQAQARLDRIDQAIASAYTRAMPTTPMVADPLLLLEREKRMLDSGVQVGSGMAFLLHEAALGLDEAPFNSLTDLAWRDDILTLKFNASVDSEVQSSALQKLKARQLEAKWLADQVGKPKVLELHARRQP